MTGPTLDSTGPVLAATGLVRSFGGRYAVNGADVALRPGTVTGLVGPNGAGKTTLLLMLAGLLAPTTECSNSRERPWITRSSADRSGGCPTLSVPGSR